MFSDESLGHLELDVGAGHTARCTMVVSAQSAKSGLSFSGLKLDRCQSVLSAELPVLGSQASKALHSECILTGCDACNITFTAWEAGNEIVN
jgi:hypothetical protein